MKFVLAILFLLASALNAATTCATGTQAFYLFDNALTDACGSNTAIGVGTPAYATTPTGCGANGTYMAGPATDANYWRPAAAVGNAITNSPYKIECYVYANSLANAPTIWSTNVGSLTIGELNADGSIRFYNAVSDDNTVAGLITTGVCYLVSWVWDGTNRRIYVDGVQKKSTTNSANFAIDPTDMFIGRYTASTGFAFDGYIDNMTFMSVADLTFPSNYVTAATPSTIKTGPSKTHDKTHAFYEPTMQPTPVRLTELRY